MVCNYEIRTAWFYNMFVCYVCFSSYHICTYAECKEYTETKLISCGLLGDGNDTY